VAHRSLAILGRRLFTGLSVLSLVLWIATLALWVRSDRSTDVIYYSAWSSGITILSTRGRVDLIHFPYVPDAKLAGFVPSFHTSPFDEFHGVGSHSLDLMVPDSGGWFLGFGFIAGNSLQYRRVRAIWCPHWFLVLLFAILPAFYLRGMLRSRRRHREGLCPVCGYDRRATPDRCPECGLATENTENTEGRMRNK
jgi:hypothetical protein